MPYFIRFFTSKTVVVGLRRGDQPGLPFLPDGGGRGPEPGHRLLPEGLRTQLLRQHEAGEQCVISGSVFSFLSLNRIADPKHSRSRIAILFKLNI